MERVTRLGPTRASALAFGVAASLAGLVACGGSGFCSTHSCIGNFDNGRGSVVQCADGEWSHSGGLPGACSGHGGENAPTGTDPFSGGGSFGGSSGP
jgi:hypothetical protein